MKLYLNMRSLGVWVAFIAIPLIINGIVAAAFVAPQKAELRDWHDAENLALLKPKLEDLLSESHRIRVEEANHGVLVQDSQGAMQAIQKTAAQYNVQVVETRMQGRDEGVQTLPFELEVTGPFNKLARWMSDIESQKNFRIDSWTLRPSQDKTLRLSIKMAALIGGS